MASIQNTAAPRAVLVYGPQGCGKTTNAERLRRHFGCTSVQDDGLYLDGPQHKIVDGALHLTSKQPVTEIPDVRVLSFAEAMAEIKRAAV